MNPAERFIASQDHQRKIAAEARARRIRNDKRVPIYVKASVKREIMAEASLRELFVDDFVALALRKMKDRNDMIVEASLLAARERQLIRDGQYVREEYNTVRLSPELGDRLEALAADKHKKSDRCMKEIFNSALVQALDAAEMELNRE